MKKVYFALFSILCLTGCFPFDEGKEEEIVGRYYVRGNSRLASVHIGYEDRQYGGVGLISEPVTAVGHNKQYIIARRGTNTTTYYILKVIQNGVHSDAEKAIIGPLYKEIFDEKLKQLGQNNFIQFDKEYEVK